ncbi:hypothetical protein JTB14_013509, partial [Gonioctena quinquepunctata]
PLPLVLFRKPVKPTS